MTSKERAAWRAKANGLEAIFQIGKEGISDNLIAQLDDALDVRELIKVRVHLESAPQPPKELAQALGEALGANVIQVIGGMIVLQRPIDEEKVRAKKAARAGDTKVTKKKVHIKGMRQRQAVADFLTRNKDLAGISVLVAKPVVVSSTQIRQRVAQGERIADLVPAAVADYIQEKGLYRG